MLRSFVVSGVSRSGSVSGSVIVSAILSCFALAGCGSSVDLCGGGAVCGVDGRSYVDRCAAQHAQVDVAYLGACAVECPVITCELACPFGFLRGSDGCPICACAECAERGDCMGADATCVAGRCTTPGVDAGTPDDDAGPTDAGGLDPDGGSCPDALALCGDRCFDLGTSDAHCGECFEVCANATENPGIGRCVGGECEAVECPEGTASCNGEGNDGCEVDLRTDPDHCGECGNSCSSAQLCRSGECLAVTEVCRDPAEWTVEEERVGYCRAKCADEVVELEGLIGSCALLSTECNLTGVLGTCEERIVRCCYDP
jgi:hypothetical protein